MGARVNFVFKTELDKPNIVLYSHWGETTWRRDLAEALYNAKARIALGDISYSTRIIIDNLTATCRDQDTGFGLSVATDEEIIEGLYDFPVFIDMTIQMVNDSGNWHSFESFTEYHLEEMTANHDFS